MKGQIWMFDFIWCCYFDNVCWVWYLVLIGQVY